MLLVCFAIGVFLVGLAFLTGKWEERKAHGYTVVPTISPHVTDERGLPFEDRFEPRL